MTVWKQHADEEVSDELNAISKKIIGAAIAVHRHLGPGLLESTYEACLAYELLQRGHSVARQKALPVVYRGVTLECGYRIDLLVDEKVVVELKAVDELAPIYKAQLISYLRLSGRELGLLINFNTTLLKNGIERAVNRRSKDQRANHSTNKEHAETFSAPFANSV
jgi:GxxExxY protein